MDYYMFTFSTIHDALAAEKLVSDQGGTIVPVPSEISAGCGFAVRLPELEPGMSILNKHIKIAGIYAITGRGSARVIKEIV